MEVVLFGLILRDAPQTSTLNPSTLACFSRSSLSVESPGLFKSPSLVSVLMGGMTKTSEATEG